MPTVQKVAPLKIRAAVRQIFSDLAGFALGKDGHILAYQLAQAEAQLSTDAKNLYAWARCIFAVFAVGRPARNVDEPSEEVIGWVLSEYSIQDLQEKTSIPVYTLSQEQKHLAAAPHTGSPRHHGVLLPPPHVPPAPQQHTGLPPMLPGVVSPVLAHQPVRLPPMRTRDEQEEEEHHSLSKRGHGVAHFGYGIGSSMTARKAAIYRTTPEEWKARSVRRF